MEIKAGFTPLRTVIQPPPRLFICFDPLAKQGATSAQPAGKTGYRAASRLRKPTDAQCPVEERPFRAA